MIARSLLLAATSFLVCSPLVAAPQIDQPAPDFQVVDTTGQTRSLAEFRGQMLVLEWSNHECPFVMKHYSAGNMQMQQRKARDEFGAAWLTVISSRPDSQGHVSAAEAEELTALREAEPTAVLLDESGDMGRAYDARVTPQMYIIDEYGILRYMGGIDSNTSRDPKDIPGATQFVIQGLDRLASGHPVVEPITRPYGCTVNY